MCREISLLTFLLVSLTVGSLPARAQCFGKGFQFYEQPIGVPSTPQTYACRIFPDSQGHQNPIAISRLTTNSDFAESPPTLENLTSDYSFGGTCQPGVQVIADEPCTVTITFTPQEEGARNAILTVHYFLIAPDGSLFEQAADLYIRGTGVPSDFRRPTVSVVEYYNAALGKYLLTSAPLEIVALDNGLQPGWTRSGFTFNGLTYDPNLGTATCRYYVVTPGDFTHWYFLESSYRCGWLEYSLYASNTLQFVLEDPNVFSFIPPSPDAGWCPYATMPLYQLWNGKIDHRWTTDPAVSADMIAQGWLAEGYGPGVVACVAK